MASRWINLDDKDIDVIKKALFEYGSVNEHDKLIRKLEKAQKKITVASAKGKGRELQKWVCSRIAKMLGIEYDQQDDHCPIHSREMGQAGVDVIVRKPYAKYFPFAVECKSSESLSLKAAIDQAKENRVPGFEWLLFHRRKTIPETLVILKADLFFELLNDANAWKDEMGRL